MSTLIWPVPGTTVINSPFGVRYDPFTGAPGDMHNGIDIGSEGMSIVAARGGTVTAHNPNSATAGNMLEITHADGTMTRYLHMIAGSNTVTTGARVAGNQVIGKVGNTGNSTGPHLHFEYKINGVAVDPMPYFGDIEGISDGSALSDIANDYGNNSITGISPSDYDGPATPTTVSEFLSDRPMCAYYKIRLGDVEFEYSNRRPQHYQTFEINRLEDAGCTAQFTLFDDNWDEIEYYLSENWFDIHMRYGYADSNIVSPEYKMIIQNYSIDFMDTGTILSIDAISEGIYKNADAIDELDTGTKNPTEAVKFICDYMNWKVDDTNFDVSEDVEREENYILDEDHPLTYITQVILPEAQANGEIFYFYLDADDHNTAYFKLDGEISDSDSGDIRTYVYQKGYNSVVESIRFDIKGVFGGTSNLHITTGAKASVFDPVTKLESYIEHDQNTVTTNATGIYSHTMARQSVARLATAGETANQVNNKIFYYIKNSTAEAYEAIMTIIGDPTIELFEDIRIINMTDLGYLHHTSGIYTVLGITDSISDGKFMTTLKLHRATDIQEGIELRNPRYRSE